MMRSGCHHLFDARRGARWPPVALSAFTLVEMVVVVAIILVILGLTLPALNTLWEDRKIAQAQNMVQGLLMRARADSMSGAEHGLFFFVDSQNVQRIVSIEQGGKQQGGERGTGTPWLNVFEITRDSDMELPVPMHVVPRYVVDEDDPNGESRWETFSIEELANDDFTDPPTNAHSAQRHRSFFTMVYRKGLLDDDGTRDVLIQDSDDDQDGLGDVTRLRVGKEADPPKLDPQVEEYFTREATVEGTPNDVAPLDSEGFQRTVPFLLTDKEGRAINFRRVDGLLVYDDSSFQDAGTGDSEYIRMFLLRTAQPFYVNRFTGMVIRGPSAESDAS